MVSTVVNSDLSIQSSVIQLSGGLGNQLFQLALGLAVFGDPGKDFFLDSSLLLHKGSLRNLELDGILDEVSFVSSPVLNSKYSRRSKSLSLEKHDEAMKRLGLRILSEQRKLYDHTLSFGTGLYLKGSFIHPAYWGEKKVKIISQINNLLVNALGATTQQAKSKFTLGIHIRRGDYSSDAKARNFHGLCGVDYYKTSLGRITNIMNFDEIIVFSDQTRIAKKFCSIMKLNSSQTIIDNSKSPLSLLYKMSMCDAFIGCNSTLSWWASFLGVQKSRTLPSSWFLNPDVTINPKSQFFPFKTIIVPNVLQRKEDII